MTDKLRKTNYKLKHFTTEPKKSEEKKTDNLELTQYLKMENIYCKITEAEINGGQSEN